MLLNSLFLAISSSIDSLGIGITYGIKNIKISYIAKIILFAISFGMSIISICFGVFFKDIFPDFITKCIGSFILIGMGVFVCFQSLKETTSFDFDNSNNIDSKEAFFLGIALSLDSICIGIAGSIIGINSTFFPFLVSIFQFVFLSLGNFIGSKLRKVCHIPNNVWSIISGILLIIIGISRI